MPTNTRSRRRRGAELAQNVADAENMSPEEALNQAQTAPEALNPEQLQIILSALDDEVERRCKRLKTEATELTMAIRAAVSVEIMKLPKCVRSLTVAQFNENGADAAMRNSVDGAAGEVRQKFSERGVSAVQTPGIRRRGDPQLTTPASNVNAVPPTPLTASRRPRRGEVILSVNGSPLGEVNNARMATGKPENVNLTVSLPEGELVSLANLGAESNGASKDEKVTALQKLKDRVDNMLGELMAT